MQEVDKELVRKIALEAQNFKIRKMRKGIKFMYILILVLLAVVCTFLKNSGY